MTAPHAVTYFLSSVGSERLVYTEKVAGSNPTGSTIYLRIADSPNLRRLVDTATVSDDSSAKERCLLFCVFLLQAVRSIVGVT